MDIRLLGPVEARIDGRPVPVGGAKQRALLAILALNAARTVSAERLIEGLWGEEPPPTAVKTLRTYVSRMRNALQTAGDGATIVTRPRGYELRVAPDDVDARRFERLVARGAPREALALWRGRALEDVADEPFAAVEIRRLEELRLDAIEHAIDRELAAGGHHELVGELGALVMEHPLRERLRGQLMLALYRGGRQADALAAYRDARATLVDQIGVEPGTELQRLHEAILRHDPSLAHAAGGGPALGDGRVVVCPFKGLAWFDVEDAGVFFGRELLVSAMVARLASASLLGVVGPSGSGKSSLLRAGLLASLEQGALPGSERWPIALLRPGEHPLRALERARAQAQDGGRLIVAIDQFEEVFTACGDEIERAAFIDALVDCVPDERRRTLVLVALRADFYGRCAGYPELAALLSANHVLVGPMRRDELARAIELPARRAGLTVDPDVVDALIADVEGEAGGLPLLSTALLELWQRRDGRRLRMSAYEQTGGVRGAIARLAENAYARLDPAQRETARRILLRLADQGEGESAVRRRVELAELEVDRDERVAEVLTVLAGDRLVTIGEGAVEVAHEALLREWPRLRGWLEQDRDGRRLHRHLRAEAREWDAGGRDAGELYRGARLAAALEWAGAHGPELNAGERAFLDAGRAANERSQRRLRAVLAGVAALLVLSVIAGIVALEQRGSAREQAVAADAQRLGARALVEDDLDRALLLARQGVALDDSAQTQGNLLAALLKSPAVLGILRGDDEPVMAIGLSRDERTLAAGTNTNKIFLFDTRTRRRLATLNVDTGAYINAIAFSPDGRRLAVGYNLGSGVVTVFDLRRRRGLARMSATTHGFVSGLGFSPDGRELDVIFASAYGLGYGVRPAILRRFDARTGAPRYGPVPINRAGSTSLMTTSDGRRLVAVGYGETVVRDAQSLRVLMRLPIGGRGASQYWATALASDDRTVAIGGEDGSVRLLDLETGARRTALGSHVAEVFGARFTPDGHTLVTTGVGGDVIVWDVQRATISETHSGQPGRIVTPLITRDGRTLYTAGPGAAVFIWDLAGTRRLGRPFSTAAPTAQPGLAAAAPGQAFLALSSDGRLIARGHNDGAVTIFDGHTLARRRSFPVVTTGPVHGLAFVPRSGLLVVTGWGFLALADADRGRVLELAPDHIGDVLPPAISADGRLLVTAGDDQTVRLWSLPDMRPIGARLRFANAIQDVQISPDGRWLTIVPVGSSGESATLEVWDAASRRRVARLEVPDRPTAVRFSPDGRLLAVGYPNGRSQVWSTATWNPVTRLLAGDVGDIYAMTISPDNSTLATGSLDRTVRLWDIETQQAIGTPLPGPGRGVGAVAPYFTPDGTALITSYDTGRAYRWDLRPESLARHACQVAGRRLTRAEWTEFLPARDYNPAC